MMDRADDRAVGCFPSSRCFSGRNPRPENGTPRLRLKNRIPLKITDEPQIHHYITNKPVLHP
jgi:hypothetical protein